MPYHHKYLLIQAVFLCFMSLQNVHATPQPRLVKDIHTTPNANLYSRLSQLVVLNGISYFSAWDGVNRGLWKSDGTADGTKLVLNKASSFLTVVNNTLFLVLLIHFMDLIVMSYGDQMAQRQAQQR